MLPYSIIFARKFGKQHCISLEYHKTLSSSLYRRIWKSFTYMPTDKRCDVCKSSLFVSLRWQNKSADFIKLHKTDWTSQTLFSCDSHNWLQIYVWYKIKKEIFPIKWLNKLIKLRFIQSNFLLKNPFSKNILKYTFEKYKC